MQVEEWAVWCIEGKVSRNQSSKARESKRLKLKIAGGRFARKAEKSGVYSGSYLATDIID